MEGKLIKKENNEIINSILDEETINSKKFYNSLHNEVNHLCTDCDNCSASKCMKVFDEVKKSIEEYDFIIDGLQVYGQNGEMKYFYVSKCDNYVKDKERKQTSTMEEIERLTSLKESIKILYFDAENIEEADRIQMELLRRGQLKPYAPYTKSKIRK